MTKQVAIVGAGLQAKRRIGPIEGSKDYRVTLVVDRDEARAKALAPAGAKTATDYRAAIDDPNVSIVLVLTYPDTHAEIAIAAMRAGKDVLCEKPLTRTLDEARAMVAAAKETGRVLKCGFNHRHHPAVLEAHARVARGDIGKPIFGRGRYGIGGRIGIEREWRSDPKIVSGGQLMEQGIHLVDLFRWFFGDPARVTGFTSTTRWPIAPLEDNGFALMQMPTGAICSVHSSLTQWTNLFELEVFGEKGAVTVEGLGASYGVEKLRVSLHDPTGPFAHQTVEFRGGDSSWKSEWEEMTRAVAERRAPLGSGEDGLRAMEIVLGVYEASKTGAAVRLGA
jgi:predicted dehydrogenase